MHPLLILGALALSALKRRKSHTVGDSGDYAFLYQLPVDSYTTTRLAFSSGGDDPKEIGIFDSPEKAKAVAQANGWAIAYGGQVLQLANKPG
jgi:hypothetical protein